jgi:tetratricopeptide (TPR) repeat protein
MLIVLFSLFLSCSPQLDSLFSIERYIQSDPAKALEKLQAYPGDIFTTPREKALYSLLYSMALDKNYIDLQTDSIIRPAVNYYTRTRDRYHKFLSYYYLGRVLENREDYEEALDKYMVSESYVLKAKYPDYYVRLCFAKERIYVRQFSYDKAIEAAFDAKEYSRDLQNKHFYIRNCLDISSLYFGLKEFDKAKKELDALSSWLEKEGLSIPSEYYYALLRFQLYDGDVGSSELTATFNGYLDSCQKESVSPDKLLCTDVMLRLGDNERAKSFFETAKLVRGGSTTDSISYYATAAHVFKDLRIFDDYAFANDTYYRLSENLHLKIHKNDIRFLEERFQKEQELAAQRRHRIYLIILVCALCVLLAASFARSEKRRKEYSIALEEARRDYDFLHQVAGQSVGTPSEIQTILSSRLAALAPYFQGVHTKQLGRQDIARLKHDNQEMLRSIGLLYSLSFPEFVAALVGKGLNAEEIGLCSLYASGFVTKELSSIIDSGSIYHINSSIRAKLGDEVGGRTLPAWLRDLFASCQKV